MQQRQLTPDAISNIQDLIKLPFLTKSIIREHQQKLISRHSDPLLQYNTGGSSGEPLIFYMGMDRVSHDVAAKWRATRWWGVDIGDVEAVIWGSPIELNKQDRVKLWRDRLFRSHLIPAFELGKDNIERYLKKLVTLKPAMVFGYPSVIYLLVQQAQQQGIDLSRLGVKVVFTTSEMLYPHQRELIEQQFGAPVANGYGARDAGFIAHQCPQGSLHISSEHILVEIIDPQGKPLPAGETGEIVTTHLATTGFPFVRYRTGDMGRLATTPCSCGRTLPVLEEVSGRSTDFLTATDGAKVHALALIYVLREIDGMEQFKITQHSATKVTVLVMLQAPDSSLLKTISDRLKQRLGDDMEITITPCTQIPTSPNGKFRYVESHI
ncbi:phenylacetate--CoA ligase family protein [Motiliproteus coralliicola]|nr:AMP-binding protein [Motiliproteus coralliicola]